MSKRNIQERNFNSIGKSDYDFDFELEMNIYSYLYGINKKRHKQLKDKYKFSNYNEWKNYIQRKYSDKEYNSERLICFSRYLSQRIRNLKPNQEYWNIVIPIAITLVIEEVIKALFELDVDVSNAGIMWLFGSITILLLLVFLIIVLIVFIYKMVKPLWENNEEESLLTDYKEVIDDIIKVKTKEEKKEKKEKKSPK